MRTEAPESWVVYRMTLHGKRFRRNAVCPQSEWNTIELDRPGYHTLIQAGIANEQDAEKLARGIPG
jgi:hypothetical protein